MVRLSHSLREIPVRVILILNLMEIGTDASMLVGVRRHGRILGIWWVWCWFFLVRGGL